MSEESSLYNPGFLGSGGFHWWVGQIADDSTWRDNILSGKFESKDSIPGWGRRYKVRIIGLHDQEEETIPSDQLPWANIMYPITAGGGQTNAVQTANLRQGMFVFGFFLDGQEMEVPVIIGVLGNNAQTAMKNKIGQSDSNFAATSGYAEGKDPPTSAAKPKVPDSGKVTTKPKSAEQSKECSSPPPGVNLNQFGLRPDLSLSKAQFADQQRALVEAEGRGLTGPNKDAFVQQAVAAGIKNRCKKANSPGSPSQPGATKENPDAVHELSAGDVVREEKYQEKIPLMKPDDKVGSAIKCIQTVIDNLTQKINKYLKAITNYIDAVSSKIGDLQNLIANAACEIAKYMKIIFDKIMEYVLKLLNKTLTKVVSAIPSSLRYQFGDMKEIITELILQLYNKITAGLCGLIQDLLNKALKPDEAEKQARENLDNPPDKHTTPKVPICYAEEIVGQAISFNKKQITEVNDSILSNVNTFLDDIQNQLAGVSGALSNISSLAGTISGSMSSALSFSNLVLNVFAGELSPNRAVSDFYTFASGGAALPDSLLPIFKAVENAADKPPIGNPVPEIPYLEPTKDTSDLTLY
jgi:uncharacterized protein YoxC